jgi:hypothetical protein
MKVYLARESKISRLLELEADVGKWSQANSHWVAQIHRMRAARHEIAQRLSKARASRSAREPDYNLLDFGAWKMKELPLRKNVQVDAILRRKSKG